MLESVWWCRHSKMESWSWTIYCLMNCSNEGINAHVGVVEDCMLPTWIIVGKQKFCCWLVLRFQKGRDVDRP